MNEIIELSKTLNSLEISRLLNLSLNDVEDALIEYYYDDTWKVSKEQMYDLAKNVYVASPLKLAQLSNISEPTLKKYLRSCHLYNDKTGALAESNVQIDDSEVCRDYCEGMSIDQLIVKYKISQSKILNVLKSNNISTDKVTFDDTIFDVIDSEEKAYWLGFFYADAGLDSGERANGLEVSLKLTDVEHLYKMKKFFKSRRDVRIQYKGIQRCRMTLYSKHFKERLIELGCTPRKSLTLKFPTEEQVPRSLIVPFIRGYYDGDGVLSYTISNKRNLSVIPQTGMLGTEDFINGVLKTLPELSHKTMLKANADGADECKIISWGKADSIYLLDTIYKDASIYLNRKFERYKYFKNNNFAVLRSDLKNNDWAISVKAKQFINKQYNIDIDELLQANAEITEETKESSVS